VKIRNWKSSDKRNWELMIKVEMVNGVVWIFQYMQLKYFSITCRHWEWRVRKKQIWVWGRRTGREEQICWIVFKYFYWFSLNLNRWNLCCHVSHINKANWENWSVVNWSWSELS
jgi:hypothetical protein